MSFFVASLMKRMSCQRSLVSSQQCDKIVWTESLYFALLQWNRIVLNKLISSKLSRDHQEAIIQAKLTWILSQCCPEQVILFGSASTYQMRDSSDIDIVLVFKNRSELNEAKKDLFTSRSVNDWPHDILYHTKETFRKSVDSGGGATYLADKEGRILFTKGDES